MWIEWCKYQPNIRLHPKVSRYILITEVYKEHMIIVYDLKTTENLIKSMTNIKVNLSTHRYCLSPTNTIITIKVITPMLGT